MRRFAGTKSNIDRAYGTRLYHNTFEVLSARVIDFSSVHGASDHDPIPVSTIPWTTPDLHKTRCAQWNRRDVQLYRALVSRALQDVEASDSSRDAEDCYSRISGCMLAAMHQVNASRPQTTRPTPDVSDWHQLVKQLARQAKRRSKTFFRHVKHTLLTPPSPSTLPVPTGKIQRILQGNSHWCRMAAEYIPWSPTLPDVPPPTVPELRSLARSARKKSPGPDGVPPYLLSILPDPCVSLVHRCLSLCYETGHIPHAWLTSETLCVYKGKGPWRDLDRWRPIAMSNSIYRLLMRWTHMRLYPLLSPLINTRQFGDRRGVSTAHATQAFLNDLDTGTSWEAIYAFDMYHAFDSPPKMLISEVVERMGTPLKPLRLIQTVLEHGSTFIRGSPDEVF